MNKLTVESIKKMGGTINIEHFRASKSTNACLPLRYFRLTKNQADIDPKAGMTFVNVVVNNKTYSSLAKTHPSDAYIRRIGVVVALASIAKQMVAVGIEEHKTETNYNQSCIGV